MTRVVVFVGLLLGIELLPLSAIVVAAATGDPMAVVVATASVVLALVTAGVSSRSLGMGVVSGLLFPIGVGIVGFSQLRGGVIGFLRGGIQWRDTFYSSAQLQEGSRVRFP